MSDEQLEKAARALFLSVGPHVSTVEIAKKLGFSQAALFKRTATKEELMVRALGPTDPPRLVRQLAMGPDADRPVPEQLEAITRALLGFFRDELPGMLTLRAAGIPLERVYRRGGAPSILTVREDLLLWLKLAHRQRRVRNGDLDCMTELLAGAVEARSFAEHVSGKKRTDDAAFCHGLVRALWKGLAPELPVK